MLIELDPMHFDFNSQSRVSSQGPAALEPWPGTKGPTRRKLTMIGEQHEVDLSIGLREAFPVQTGGRH